MEPLGSFRAVVTAPPTLRIENAHRRAGDRVICGIDEVGRGAWAGPVTVAAVVAAPKRTRALRTVRDSKLLTAPQREVAAEAVRAWAPAVGIGHASHEECDELGMTAALRAAGHRALAELARAGFEPDRIILDGTFDYLDLGGRVHTIVKADVTSLAVAAASCVAKVTRDAMMAAEAEHFPAYGFESNRGYRAPVHRSALLAYGPSTIHRRSWIFMAGLPWRTLDPPRGRLFC